MPAVWRTSPLHVLELWSWAGDLEYNHSHMENKTIMRSQKAIDMNGS
jgi:hypothetical protein